MNQTGSERRARHAVGALFVQAFVSLLCAVVVFLQSMGTPACSEQCNYQLLEAATIGYYLVLAVAFFASVLIVYYLRNRGWWAVVSPAVGTAVVVIGFFVAFASVNRALGV